MGAIMGTLVGDGLGLGCHWYYDLDQLRRDFGPWISGYTNSKPDRSDSFGRVAKLRYDAGLKGRRCLSDRPSHNPLARVCGTKKSL